ncbi:coiled-coil domain-containing protein 86 [Hyposmocoma kahamanoa]|uniref:coiled-coil domain-containing protein 86 n=1 Tax=Hyposmocoma kahamanoa TaxID=1477025 RepID=UPI000E6D69CF|nr:coiled-coil domain-containing protein 86 [Hyposmocoma kahamanoa]
MTEETNEKVLSILANIKNNQENAEDSEKLEKVEVISGSKQKLLKKKDPIMGKPKSGRFWKSKRERFSSINKTKGLRQDFVKKTALRIDLQRTKELSKQVQEELKQKELNRKERRRENIKRAEENKRKAEIVQVITNSAKLKRMKKKQLRFIEKRDTNKQIEASK